MDAILLRVYKVEVFADDPECILRWSRGRLERAVTLPDGSRLRPGDIVIELHFWNEHLPQIADNGADFLWGKEFARRLVHSLRLLAVQALGDPRFADFAALHAEVGFIPAADVESLHGLAWRFGFLLEIQEVAGRRVWKKAFWAGLYSWWLMWAFNPGTLKRKKLVDMARSHLWMTRATLLARYGEEGGTAEVDAVACHARQEKVPVMEDRKGLCIEEQEKDYPPCFANEEANLS
ncbi:MAG: hypothetical protein H5T84_03550, partial [Thermoleophilia bacterium]|nr:hypothetical protein [Thermoleophilia bacterium]